MKSVCTTYLLQILATLLTAFFFSSGAFAKWSEIGVLVAQTGVSGGGFLKPPKGCPVKVESNCVLSVSNSGQSTGFCDGGGGSTTCSYRCLQGLWHIQNNTCKASCSFGSGETLLHGESKLFFDQNNPVGTMCNSESRGCNDGTLSGSFSKTSCVNGCPGASSFEFCILNANKSGDASGSCISGASGTCSYSCENGSRSRQTNTCVKLIEGWESTSGSSLPSAWSATGSGSRQIMASPTYLNMPAEGSKYLRLKSTGSSSAFGVKQDIDLTGAKKLSLYFRGLKPNCLNSWKSPKLRVLIGSQSSLYPVSPASTLANISITSASGSTTLEIQCVDCEQCLFATDASYVDVDNIRLLPF